MEINLDSRIDLPVSQEPPQVMHIDLNSAFATAEQQWRPHLRNRSVGITNRLTTPDSSRAATWSICITSSYEAKRQGIVIGTRHRDAQQIDPNFVMLESDPSKYIHVYNKLKAIFESYSPTAYMKSIDEGIIDFRGMRAMLKGRSLTDIGYEIKQRVRDEVGDYMSVNVGIGQNLWLAKVAASLHKPDGLDVIEGDRLEEVYSHLRLTDLPYIKRRNQIRLSFGGIYTCLDFFRAPYWVLFRQVFNSVLGHHWYLRLRGYEVDMVFDDIKTSGRSYVLEHRTSDPEELLTLLHKAAFKVSRKLYAYDLAAKGLALGFRYGVDYRRSLEQPTVSRWKDRHKWPVAVRREDEIFSRAKALFERSPQGEVVTAFELSTYALEPAPLQQPTLFEDYHAKRNQVQSALDRINDQFGEMTVVPADVKASKNPMKDKLPFYNTKYFEITGA